VKEEKLHAVSAGNHNNALGDDLTNDLYITVLHKMITTNSNNKCLLKKTTGRFDLDHNVLGFAEFMNP